MLDRSGIYPRPEGSNEKPMTLDEATPIFMSQIPPVSTNQQGLIAHFKPAGRRSLQKSDLDAYLLRNPGLLSQS
jgi:hypothetical protein